VFTFIVPVHNESATLPGTMQQLDAARARYPIDAIVAVENGSRDDTWAVLQQLAGRYPALRVFAEPAAGIGHAYHRGIAEALRALPTGAETYLVLTACDLPFGFTDLDSMLALPVRPPVAIGSKAKLVGRTPSLGRRAMSVTYQLARRALVGMQTRDCQGSFLVHSDVARRVHPQIRARDFFYTTELCARLEHQGIAPVEVAIELAPEVRPSTVRPFKHGTAMLRQLVALRRELAAEARAGATGGS
jgi:glycosyltransferase involved in cell wall biosynthesis